MKKISLVIGIALITILAIIMLSQESEAEVITVDNRGLGDHTTLFHALEAANSGDTIHLWEGEHGVAAGELIVIDDITIIGNGTNTIITSHVVNKGVFSLIEVYSSDVTIENVFIQGGIYANGAGLRIDNADNFTIRGCEINSAVIGAEIINSDNVVIEDCTFTGEFRDLEYTNDYSLRITDSDNLRISDTNFYQNTSEHALQIRNAVEGVIEDCNFPNEGIHVEDSYNFTLERLDIDVTILPGMLIEHCENFEIQESTIEAVEEAIEMISNADIYIGNNQVTSNVKDAIRSYDGHIIEIYLNWIQARVNGALIEYSSDVEIHNNEIENCEYGITLINVDQSLITNNDFQSNDVGLFIDEQSTAIVVKWNNFLNSLTAHAISLGEVTWFDTPENGGGNYWDTWTGPDEDGDGYTDFPYSLGRNSSPNAFDSYPLADPIERIETPGIGTQDNFFAPILESNNNVLMWIGLGIFALVVIVGGVIYATRRKK